MGFSCKDPFTFTALMQYIVIIESQVQVFQGFTKKKTWHFINVSNAGIVVDGAINQSGRLLFHFMDPSKATSCLGDNS